MIMFLFHMFFVVLCVYWLVIGTQFVWVWAVLLVLHGALALVALSGWYPREF